MKIHSFGSKHVNKVETMIKLSLTTHRRAPLKPKQRHHGLASWSKIIGLSAPIIPNGITAITIAGWR